MRLNTPVVGSRGLGSGLSRIVLVGGTQGGDSVARSNRGRRQPKHRLRVGTVSVQ